MDRLLLWVVGVVVFSGMVTVNSTNPGLQMKVTKKGLEYVSKIGVELVKKNLNYFTLPSSSSSGFTVKNLRVSSLALPYFTISPSVPDNGMKVRISNARFDIDGSWSYYRSGLFGFSDSGSLDISVSSIELSLVIGVGEKDGQFVISTSSRQCVSNYGPIHVGIHGAGTMVGMYVDDIKSQIRNKLRSQLNEVCHKIVTKVNGMLQSAKDTKLVFNIDEYAYADYSLVSAPKFSEQAFESLHKGEILSRKDQQNVSVPNPEIPAHTETSRMMYLWLTEYTTASAANVYFKAGVMEYLITKDMVPSEFSLNTSKFPFNKAIPQIEKIYPNLDMVANFEVTSPPVLNMTTEGLKCSLVGQLDFYVTQENKEEAFVFSLSVSMSLSASVSVNTKKNAITGSFTLDSSSFKFAESAEILGEISANVKKLDKVMDTLFGTIIPKVNEKGAEGLPIPSVSGIELVKPQISFGKGFILIATDINHTVSLEYRNVMKMYKDIKNYNPKDEL